MRTRLLILLPALLLAAPAFAIGLFSDGEDVRYPDQETTFAECLDSAPIVTSDATYEGPHALVFKTRDLVPSNLIASNEDVSYSTSDELSGATEEAVPEDTRVAMCGCPTCSGG